MQADLSEIRQLLDKTEEKCRECFKCPLGQTRTKADSTIVQILNTNDWREHQKSDASE